MCGAVEFCTDIMMREVSTSSNFDFALHSVPWPGITVNSSIAVQCFLCYVLFFLWFGAQDSISIPMYWVTSTFQLGVSLGLTAFGHTVTELISTCLSRLLVFLEMFYFLPHTWQTHWGIKDGLFNPDSICLLYKEPFFFYLLNFFFLMFLFIVLLCMFNQFCGNNFFPLKKNHSLRFRKQEFFCLKYKYLITIEMIFIFSMTITLQSCHFFVNTCAIETKCECIHAHRQILSLSTWEEPNGLLASHMGRKSMVWKCWYKKDFTTKKTNPKSIWFFKTKY